MTKRFAARDFFYDVVLKHDSDECLLWPFRKNRQGYGTITIDGKSLFVARMVCKFLYGDPPPGWYHAAHNCGNGHIGCCNPKHLRWATAKENMADRVKHGTQPFGEAHHSAKLTEKQAIAIKLSDEPTTVLAKRYNIGETQVHNIRRGKTWTHLAKYDIALLAKAGKQGEGDRGAVL